MKRMVAHHLRPRPVFRIERPWVGDTRRFNNRFLARMVEASEICMAYLVAFSYVIFAAWLALVLTGALYRLIFTGWR